MKWIHYLRAKWDQWRLNVRHYEESRKRTGWSWRVMWEEEPRPRFRDAKPLNLRDHPVPDAIKRTWH